jgi:uncharacterized membrane protein YqaE (UPF0057 family)
MPKLSSYKEKMSNLPSDKDYVAPDPNDYNFVSKKNWARKQKYLTSGGDIASIIGRPGPVTGMIVGIIDVLVTLIIKFFVNLFTLCTQGFNWLYNMFFANFHGIIPSSLSGGAVISMRFFRYMFTVIMPPFGILLSKGLYGWFSIIVCIIITYVNYMAGIIYAFVLTSRNRYADQYEAKNIKDALAESNNETLEKAIEDSTALFGTCGFVLLLGFVIFMMLSFF